MSGPKVVRIVTREELVEICQGHLARVDAAHAEWIRIGRRNNCIDEEAIAEGQKRRQALAALLAANRFMDVQKHAPIEEAYLRRDMQDRLEKVAAAQAEARSRERRASDAGKTLLRLLQAAGSQLESSLERGLFAGDADALATGFRLLAESSAATVRTSNELAAGLRDEGSKRTFVQWMEELPSEPADASIERIEHRIAEIALTLDAATTADMRARLDEAKTAPRARRSLLIDGLEVESARRLEAARHRGAILEDLRLLIAECEAASLVVAAGLDGTATATVAELEGLAARTRTALDVHRAAKAAAARRDALLKGLSELGYEVTEGMSTTTAEDGRLVMRSVSRPGYGVEIASVDAADRMQVRPVAFQNGGFGPDRARDRDAETIWCGDVSRLQESLAQWGGELAIERALPVGAVALKRIELPHGSDSAERTAPAVQQRSLPK